MATKVCCQFCNKKFWARKDALYCSNRCRKGIKQLDAKIEIPVIPKSGVQGITYARTTQRWHVKIRLSPSDWKYIGSKGTLQEAINYQKEVLTA